MTPPLTRRGLVAGAAIGSVGLAAATAQAVEQQPRELFGTVSGAKVELPPLHAPTEASGPLPNPDPVGRRMGVAVVGLGHLALEQIMPAFGQSKHTRPVALVSGEPDKAKAVAAQHGVPESGLYDYTTFDRLRDNPAVDFVYIVLPNSLHREYVERAAAAGKHVLCEKPMATSSADARAMIAACAQAGRKLMIAYRIQYEPTNREAIRMVRAGELGQIRLIEAVNGQNDLGNGQWRQIKAMAGGGSLPDVGIYCLNTIRAALGEEPIEVAARITRPQDDARFREIEDVCAFTLRFPSGVVASCSSGYSFHESRRYRVHGSEGWVELDPAFGYDNLELHTYRKSGPTDLRSIRRFPPQNQFALELDHFAECIASDRVPRTPGEEGLQDMLLIEAIYRAAEAGAPVTLAEIAGRDVTRGPPLGG